MAESKASPTPRIMQACFICGAKSCGLITHRLTTLEAMRRLSKGKKRLVAMPSARPEPGSPSHSIDKAKIEQVSLASRPPSRTQDWLDPFIPFPVKGVSRRVIAQFYDFFKNQACLVDNTERSMAFDGAHYPYLFPMAMQNPALCMSLVAMAETYAAVHGRNITAPDASVLMAYGRSFQELRTQIKKESRDGISEASVMAAINLVMCCGVAFSDPEATLTHWNGVLALLEKPRAKLYSGALMAFIEGLEHWMVITMGTKPRSSDWPFSVAHERPPPKIYGTKFEAMSDTPLLDFSSLTLHMVEMCLNTCRCTEILELPDRESSYKTYFPYFRGVVNKQGNHMYYKTLNTDTLDECMANTLSVYYITVLRLTPWRAPFNTLFSNFRRTLANCGLTTRKGIHEYLSRRLSKSDTEKENMQTLFQNMYTWMLFFHACAASFARDQEHLHWTIAQIRDVLLPTNRGLEVGWRTRLHSILEEFCWSTKFLANQLDDVCHRLENKDRPSTCQTEARANDTDKNTDDSSDDDSADDSNDSDGDDEDDSNDSDGDHEDDSNDSE